MKNFTGNNRFQNKANPLLSKPRHFTDRKTVKSIYHATFKPHLYYSSLVWPQNSNSIKRLLVLQKKSLRIIYFQNYIAHTSPLFRESSTLKLPEKIALENCLFIIGLLSHMIFIPTILVGPI